MSAIKREFLPDDPVRADMMMRAFRGCRICGYPSPVWTLDQAGRATCCMHLKLPPPPLPRRIW